MKKKIRKMITQNENQNDNEINTITESKENKNEKM